jgi:hypothetical protein
MRVLSTCATCTEYSVIEAELSCAAVAAVDSSACRCNKLPSCSPFGLKLQALSLRLLPSCCSNHQLCASVQTCNAIVEPTESISCTSVYAVTSSFCYSVCMHVVLTMNVTKHIHRALQEDTPRLSL